MHKLTLEQLCASLKSGPGGLAQNEAQRRLAEFGPNQVEQIGGEKLARRLLREFTHFFALILWLAAGLAFFAEWNDPGQGMATLGAAIVGVIMINGAFSFWQEYRAEKALSALRSLLPNTATALRDGKAVQVTAAELVPGDVVLLAAGDNIPADCRLIEAEGVRVNTATVSGESLPKARDTRATQEAELLLNPNVLLAGTALVSGKAKALVFATGMRTAFGDIARLTQTARAPLSPLQREIMHLSRLVAIFASTLGAVFFLIGTWLGLSFWENLIFAIGIIVANVPEGLLPTVTMSLALATQRMAKKNALVRHLPAVETLGAATVICTDKTGTLTQNRMSVQWLFHSGTLAAPAALAASEHAAPLFEVMRHCHDLRAVEFDGHRQWLGDPLEIALLEATPHEKTDAAAFRRSGEIPFDTERKRMSVVGNTTRGSMLYCKGAPETVLPLCVSHWYDGSVQALDETQLARLQAAQENMAQQGLRVLALAYRELPVQVPGERREENLVLAGLVGLHDPPRPEVAQAISTCRGAGLRVIMVTGDHPSTAQAIARTIGLAQKPHVVTGDMLRNMTDTQLQLALGTPDVLFARIGAEQKMRIVQALKRQGEIVAVTGDGVNDAPALKCADIGIAMGIAGTDVAKEAADIVLLDDNFATIVQAVEEGRTVYDNIRKFLTYILTSNIPELVPYLAFVLFRIPLPLTIVQILAVDLGTDMLPALALGAEAPDPQVMRRPPRPRRQRLLNWPLLARAYLFLGPLEAIAAMAAFFFVLQAGGWQYGTPLAGHDALYLAATSACLSAIIVMQVINVFLCRHPTASLFSLPFFDNRMIFWGIALELGLILLIDYTSWGNALIGTAPIEAGVWLFILPFALAMLGLEELRKALARKL
ncbi:MAG: cation-transporting P-type ATPase [Pseudomonadota bacterium]